MPEKLSVRPRICQQIRSGPLGQWIDDFVDVLTARGYATSVIRRHVRAAAVFSAWLERQRVALQPSSGSSPSRASYPSFMRDHHHLGGTRFPASEAPDR